MKRVAFVVPFFGVLPDWFQLWLLSCKSNSTIDWLIFYDGNLGEYEWPKNVKAKRMKLYEFNELASKKIGIEINLLKPYKLCDFKPCYGKIFEDYLEKYDFWGFCDIDTMFGDLRAYLDDSVLSTNEKIFLLGHLSLVKNNRKMNEMFKTDGLYKTILTGGEICAFDESIVRPSLNTFCLQNNATIYEKGFVKDISPLNRFFKLYEWDRYGFRIDESLGKRGYFVWHKGKLFEAVGGKRKEAMYIHFQKRKFEIFHIGKKTEWIYIIPNKIVTTDTELGENDIRMMFSKGWLYMPYFKLRFRNLKIKCRRLLGHEK